MKGNSLLTGSVQNVQMCLHAAWTEANKVNTTKTPKAHLKHRAFFRSPLQENMHPICGGKL